jgi:4-hydroxymandelate oxidase
MTRRELLFAASASCYLRGQDAAPKLIGEPTGRITPREDVLNTFEMEAAAQRSLPARLFFEIQGSGDRTPFDHIILRPRMLVDVTHLDLSVELFGTKMYAPILVGPAADQKRFHPDGELAMVRGASAAQTAIVVSDRTSIPIDQIATEAKAPLWYQIYPQADMGPILTRVQQAVKAGCRAVCITLGEPNMGSPRVDWQVVEQVRQAANVPVLLKGVMSPDEAKAAVQNKVSGIIVSANRFVPGLAAPMDMLPLIVDAFGKQVPVLVDGGFRRGTDILCALALGARAVLVTRPVLWGLAAYGADGVRTVLEMLQSETARDMALCGKPNLASIDRSLVRMHVR